ncbi:cytochrome P450 [Fodinicola acaciae]|uniref:cytochrome P450 n=1 Tax=Fodinicola acaciae TaxID=2681555 RepID=UPI0013D33827|nr:cytochrome P450 [Fodinicola acaciae]
MTVQLPLDRPHPLATAPLLRSLQRSGPIHQVRTRVGDPAWLVTGYDEVRQLWSDDRLGMSHPDPDNAARINDSALFGGKPQGNYETEKEDRARFRSLVQPFFGVKQMRAIQPRVEQLVSDLLDRMSGQPQPADLHELLALPLPVLVICELLGVPYEDRARFREWSQAAGARDDEQLSRQGIGQLWEYTRTLVGRKRAEPADDVISGLCAAENGTLDDDHIAMIAAMLLFAGHETTVVQIDAAAVLLLTNLDQWDAIVADPALVQSAVEECLRASHKGGGGVPRYPRTDIEVAGVTIPAGDLVLLDGGAANHDTATFAEPERVDVHRGRGAHLTFGFGAHYCIGAPLARIELQAVLRQLIERFPNLRLAAPVEELPVFTESLTGGFASVPVTW